MKITANGLSFEVIGEGSGPAVLLLHGFPDSSALWRHQIPALVAAGHRVIAPDLRGFGASDRPAEVEAYAMPTLVTDVLGLLDALGIEHVDLVGHDWGAALAWTVAIYAPDRVRRLAVLSVGHPAGFFTEPIAQRERSWYMLFFQFPGVAEEALPREDWALWRTVFGEHGDVQRYWAELSRPGALTAALNWYRANSRPEVFGWTGPAPVPPAHCPVLGIWSDGDRHLGEAQMLASAQHVTGPWRYERIAGASHWIPLDAPDLLNRLLVDFFDEADPVR